MELAVMLGFALIFGGLMRRLNQPAVLGEIIGGIILGQTVLGTIAPDLQSGLFPASGISARILHALAYLGLIAFVFIAGLEVDLTCIRRRSRSTVITSLCGIALPFALGFGMVSLMPGIWGIPSGELRIFALFMGTALSISALPVIARILMDLNLLKAELGAMIITAATINDLVGWSLFALILGSLNPGTGIGPDIGLTLVYFGILAIIIYRSGRSTARPSSHLIRSRIANGFSLMDRLLGIIALLLLALSVVSEFLGVHGIFGAFLAGAILSQRGERRNLIMRWAYYPVVVILAPIYFTSIGLKADFAANFDLAIVLLVFVVACAGKIVGASIGARFSGMSTRDSLVIGFGLNSRGAMEIVLASLALDYGLIGEDIFVALVIMAIATTMIGGSMIQRLMISKAFVGRDKEDKIARSHPKIPARDSS